MLLACASCNSRYLVNSADLKPKGRKVRCVACGHEWFQEPNMAEEQTIKSSVSGDFKEENNKLKQEKTFTSNLPSTYIKKEETSILNSILVVLFIITIIFVFWLIKNKEIGIVDLLNFYIQEFYFNLKLIIKDLSKLVYQIIN